MSAGQRQPWWSEISGMDASCYDDANPASTVAGRNLTMRR